MAVLFVDDGAVKLALLSDVHANARALAACMAHARAAGAARFAFLGDLVGYGAEPSEVVEQVMALADEGAIVLRGNHEQAACDPPTGERTAEEVSARWTHARLASAQRAFLAGLPLTAQLDDTLFVHASAHAPEGWEYVDRAPLAQRCLDAAQERWHVRRVFCGHVHEQQLYYRAADDRMAAFAPTPGVAVTLGAHRSWVALVGSVGQPRDGDPRAMYALLDLSPGRLAFQRVPYDHAGAAAAIRASGLPASFADRLERGR